MSNTAPVMADAASPPYLARLNPEQADAVRATDGPVLVLAGAGTGKTRVLTTRIGHLLMEGLAMPGQILAVTFTNKAAREMGERLARLLPSAPEEGRGFTLPFLGTFHSIAAKILRRHAEAVGLTSSFTILDSDDQIRLIKQILAEMNIDEGQSPAKIFLAIIQGWKDQGLTPEKVTQNQVSGFAQGKTLPVYKAYQARLRALNACDFGDLLLHNLTLFTTQPAVLAEYSQRFLYMLVDEYQDTNVAQYLWLRLLAGTHRNLCCVGDDDQSIYGWRGAEVDNILRFEKDFPGAKVVRLERNYRSTHHILGAASGLIAHNRSRLGKTLWTEEKEGDAVRLKAVWDDMEEARFIGDEIEACQRAKTPLNQIAILVRAGFQTRAFEERFMTLSIPYRVVGGLRFYERQEIRDMLAYLRLVVHPDDDLAFERVVNVPKRGLGKATMEQLHLAAREHHTSLFRASERLIAAGVVKGKAGAALKQFLDLIHRAAREAGQLSLADLADVLLEHSGYRAMWQQEKTPEAAGRLENLRELQRALGEFSTLTEFLEHVGLVTDIDEQQQDDMVSLMTLHAAKGLEFDVVFLPGWEEGVFPHQRALDESGAKGLEEERRLAYVGITRARRQLTISYAANRRIYNQWQSSVPSRFIKELPEAHIERLPGGVFGYGNGLASMPIAKTSQLPRDAALRPQLNEAAASSFAASTPFPTGTRVFHQKFGYGKVIGVTGTHLDIAFEKAGLKKLIADFVVKAE